MLLKCQSPEEAIPPKKEKRDKKDSLLPKTATNSYNWLLLGSLFIIFAIIIWGINRKRPKVK